MSLIQGEANIPDIMTMLFLFHRPFPVPEVTYLRPGCRSQERQEEAFKNKTGEAGCRPRAGPRASWTRPSQIPNQP